MNRNLGINLARERGEWCGVPFPVAGLTLTVEDRNPYRAMMPDLQRIVDEDLDPAMRVCTDDDTAWQVVNSWWSARERRTVGILRHADTGKYATFGDRFDFARRGAMLFDTLQASKVWPIEAEATAIETLATHLTDRPHLWEAYVCTGMFLETSKRSGLTYFFRRCKPTLVYNATTQKMICALCLHPMGYYNGTHAGSMVPTDDVMAHLLLMRADEPLLWRRANQHPIDRPEAGL